MAVFLAERGIDVWGIDLAWSLVPLDEQNLAFMGEWGLQRQVDEVSIALDLALSKRGKHKNRGIHLLGYSLGGVIGYAFVNGEASLPCGRRRVKGWIPFDTSVKADDPAVTARACEMARATDAMLAGGILRDATNALAAQVGFLARTDPDGASPIFPGFTNRQVAIVVLALPSPEPPGVDNPAYHLFAGIFDATTSLPVDLAHVTPSFAFEWLERFGGGAPLQLLSDATHVVCGDIELPFDDSLSSVTTPVLYVGADGGVGASGVFSTTLLGSSDVTVTLVDLEPPTSDFLDFGHIDLATASSAGFLAWDHVADWIRSHDDPVCSTGDEKGAARRRRRGR
ncbi:MAG TPA: hypothetical protein VEK15_07270 [Vicinamibacteria bacterium]|nr:hypothetical protein [Vicinamibacteria bacterium]